MVKPEALASLWPASGLAFAMAVLATRQERPFVFLVTFLVNFAGNYFTVFPLLNSLAFAFANTCEPLLGWTVFSLLLKSSSSLARIRDVTALALTAVGANALTAMLGAALVHAFSDAPLANVWMIWWISDGLGIMIVAPLIFAWTSGIFTERLPKSRIAELVIVLASIATAYLLLHPHPHSIIRAILYPSLLFGVVLWSAFRLGYRGLTITSAFTGGILVMTGITGQNFFSQVEDVKLSLLFSQIFLFVVGFMGLTVSAFVRERKVNQIGLQEQVRRFEAIFNNSPVSIWEEDFSEVKKELDRLRGSGVRDWLAWFQGRPDEVRRLAGLVRILDINRTSLRLFNVQSREQLSSSLPDYFLTESYPVFAGELAALAEGRTKFEAEIPVRTREGNPRYLALALAVVEGAERTLERIIVSFRDITETRSLQKENEDLIRNMTDGLAVHQIILDPDGKPVDYRFLNINPAFQRMTGLKPEDILGKTVREVIPGIEPKWIETYGRVAQTGIPVQFEDFTAGLNKWFFVSAYSPSPGKFACLIEDITERKQREEERRKLEEQLRQSQKMDAIGHLAGGVAHDVNNLLQIVQGHIEMALDPQPGERTQEHLQNSLKSISRTAGLIKQLLLFSRRQMMRIEDLNLNDLTAGLLKMLRRLIGENIKTIFIPGSSLGTVAGDAGMLEQVVMNLAINARDAMPKGGELVIETENVMISESDALTHPDFPLGRYVLLSVTDTGVGMDKEVKERLFEPFFTTKEPGQGTGLGLSTVYGIVKQHQGQIHFESEQGKGSTFKVYLPIVERSAADVGTKIERPVKGGTETILIAEDESDLRRLVKRFLERAGYSVLEASDGREAIDLFRKESSRIDLLLLDVVMPETGGHEVFEEARRINPKIRTLFTSGYSEDGIHTDFVLQEHCRLLQKPYEIKDLLRQVREVLDLKDS